VDSISAILLKPATNIIKMTCKLPVPLLCSYYFSLSLSIFFCSLHFLYSPLPNYTWLLWHWNSLFSQFSDPCLLLILKTFQRYILGPYFFFLLNLDELINIYGFMYQTYICYVNSVISSSSVRVSTASWWVPLIE
jgi:uncharacterized membrane protein